MTEAMDQRLLRRAAERASRRPNFLAYDLDRFEEAVAHGPAAWLGISDEELARLALCRTPRRGLHFSHDVLAIASHVGVDPRKLAALLRTADILKEL